MSNSNCPEEGRILAAARSGQWSEPLLEHQRNCAECADLVLVESMLGLAEMEKSAEVGASIGALPDPQAIWLQHQQAERLRLLEKALLPIRSLEMLVSAAAAAVAAIMLFRFLPRITGWFGSIGSQLGSDLLALPATSPATWMLVMATGTLFLVLATLHSQWARQ